MHYDAHRWLIHADTFRRAARAVDISAGPTGPGASWFFQAIAGKRNTQVLLDTGLNLLEKIIRGEASDQAQLVISRVLRGYTASELSGPGDSISIALITGATQDVDLLDIYTFLDIGDERPLFSTDLLPLYLAVLVAVFEASRRRGEDFNEAIAQFPVLQELKWMLSSATRTATLERAAKRGASSKGQRSFPDVDTARTRIADLSERVHLAVLELGFNDVELAAMGVTRTLWEVSCIVAWPAIPFATNRSPSPGAVLPRLCRTSSFGNRRP